MTKKHIAGADLSWLISEELFDPGGRRARAPLAVVPDEKDGWRVVVANRGRRLLTTADERRLVEIQRKLRLIYQIQS